MGVFTNKQDRIEALRGVAIFANLPKKDLAAMERHVTPTTVDDGTELAREGRAPQQLLLIVEGEAVVRRGKRRLATLGPGDTIGELSLLDGGKQSATVTAVGQCAVLAVPAGEFRSMLEDSPTFARNLLRSMAMRLRDADEHLTA